MNMNFVANKTPVETTKEGAFGRTYFRDIYSGINGKWWYKQSQKEFDELKNIDKKYYWSNYYDVNVNKYKVKCEASLRSRENNGQLNSIDAYGCFRGILDIGLVEDRWIIKYKLLDGKEL